MLHLTLHTFPYLSVRVAVVTFKMFPTLLRHLNMKDIVILNFKLFESGSFEDHLEYVKPI
jgi:hypothetical protein